MMWEVLYYASGWEVKVEVVTSGEDVEVYCCAVAVLLLSCTCLSQCSDGMICVDNGCSNTPISAKVLTKVMDSFC